MQKKFCTDDIARRVWLYLANDFQTTFGPTFQLGAQHALNKGVTEFRDFKFPELGLVEPYRFKAQNQLESWLKKYRFKNDKYSDKELEDITNTSYLTHQETLAAHQFTDPVASPLLKRMRQIIKSILGNPDMEEIWSLNRFGRKSSIGCPLRDAYLDVKVSEQTAFTSSSAGYKGFMAYLKGDSVLKRTIDSSVVLTAELETFAINALALVNVEKSWKTKRSITPLTLLDLFQSYGIGRVIQDRLQVVGIDIRHQQQKHRNWVKVFSNTLTHATADLSRASDCITISLMLRCLPRKWLALIKPLLRSQIEVGGRMCYTESVLPMGNGFTFPLETLIFYALLRGLSELTGTKGLISVYGDDLIYPRRLHRYVPRSLRALGFNLNLEKTYVSYPFRESCGSDFYRGVDVRPAVLQGTCQYLSPSQFCSFLYKCYNSLARRWDRVELSSTFDFLISEIERVGGTVWYVPPSYPDTAGIKTNSPQGRCLVTGFHQGTRYYQFPYLAEVSVSLRHVRCTEIYYWEKLRDGTQAFKDPTDYNFVANDDPLPSLADMGFHEPGISPILWKKSRYRTAKGWKVGRTKAFSHDKNKLKFVNQKATVTDWA
jgi:hypothetical protein